MQRRRWVTVWLMALAGLVACQSAVTPDGARTPVAQAGPVGTPVAVAGGVFTLITPDTLAEMLAAKDFYFVNTHIPYEGELEQTDAFIAYNETEARLGEFPSDPDAMIVLYCRSGRMSAIAAEKLVEAGHTNVWDLAGGFMAWEAAGFELLHK